MAHLEVQDLVEWTVKVQYMLRLTTKSYSPRLRHFMLKVFCAVLKTASYSLNSSTHAVFSPGKLTRLSPDERRVRLCPFPEQMMIRLKVTGILGWAPCQQYPALVSSHSRKTWGGRILSVERGSLIVSWNIWDVFFLQFWIKSWDLQTLQWQTVINL